MRFNISKKKINKNKVNLNIWVL